MTAGACIATIGQMAFADLMLAAALVAAEPPPLAAPTIPPAVLDDSLEVTGEAVEAQERRTRLSVDVLVNGKGPYRFLVDSGADRTVVGRDLATRLGLPDGPPVRLSSMAGVSTVGTVLVDSLRLGASTVETLTAPVLAEADIGAQGIVGIDALAEQRVMLDIDAREITVQDGRRPSQSTADEIVVVARLRKGQLILTQVTAGRERLYAIIDTGSELSIGNSALRNRIFAGKRPPPATRITLTSVSGQTIEADLVIIPQMKVGTLTLEGVSIAFADVPPFALFGLKNQPALLLGTDVLRAFRRVSLDFEQRKVRFQLRRTRFKQ